MPDDLAKQARDAVRRNFKRLASTVTPSGAGRKVAPIPYWDDEEDEADDIRSIERMPARDFPDFSEHKPMQPLRRIKREE